MIKLFSLSRLWWFKPLPNWSPERSNYADKAAASWLSAVVLVE